jgi:hypothetical protein
MQSSAQTEEGASFERLLFFLIGRIFLCVAGHEIAVLSTRQRGGG